MVESGAGPDVNILTKFCKTLAEDSHGDIKKVQRSTDCSNYLTIFKTGDWSSFIGIKFIETSNSISLITNLTQAASMDEGKAGAEATIKQCLSLHSSSLSKIDEAYEIYKNNVPMNKVKGQSEDLKSKMELLVIDATKEEETCQAAVSGLKDAPAKLIEASKFAQKVIAGSKYITKAICQFGYAPQNSKFC
ncbi:hypothetical protein LIER_36852 [Lithospermum erythrorhizon]|uniref:Pectinesterase inhibitor domain-containing protein n=1 Tax=Lithospermum erythrorhizon TaxID=34254 RepID=A0AAV3PCT2_LITER